MGTNQRAQITMTDDEIRDFVEQQRTATMATIGPDGMPHLVAMWYAVIDGVIWFETKARSQKAVNLGRDGRITVLIESGHTYNELKGVSFEGRGVVVDEAEALWAVGVNVWERYTGPYAEEMRPFVEMMLNKRVAVRVDIERTRSWDHGKLGMDPMPLGGSTAAFL
ncbi:MAG: class F420-dependent enzyme [Frankiales bacterium]|nr:class F420-dependent enzyme [Frankiales bacterium]